MLGAWDLKKMFYSTKSFICLILIALCLGLGFASVSLAQENATEAVNLDENIQAEDLDIEEPTLLPDSPFYFLKDWGRGIRSFFAFNPIKKAELKSKFANERLIEVKKMIEEVKDPDIIENSLENYQNEMDKIKEASEKIKEKAEANPKVGAFLDKFIKHQTLHYRILEKLQTQVPTEVFEKIEQARERHLERFGEVMTKLEDREDNISERLEKNMAEIKGSKYKNFKNLEVLLKLEEKVPEQAKEAIRKAQENSLKRLQGDLEKMSPENQERFKEYIDKISGEKEIHLEILENLKSELQEKPVLRQKIMEVRENILEKIEEIDRNCPEIDIEKPPLGFCGNGRILLERDENGCIVSFKCVIPSEIQIPQKLTKPQACITLWNPVCGKDGKTYSNTCFANLAEVEIDYKGVCK